VAEVEEKNENKSEGGGVRVGELETSLVETWHLALELLKYQP